MSGFIDVFKRVEKKYLLDENKYRALRKALEQHLAVDEYGKTTICNIYFDTPSSQLIRTSLEKPFFKEKMRMRSYGTPSNESTVFVELKKKFDGIVYKRRVDMSLGQAKAFTEGMGGPMNNPQIEKEIEWVMNYYEGLAPAMYLSYDRVAMYGKEDESLRVTFDSHILYRTEALSLDKGVWGNELLNSDYRIMEIKLPNVMPLWLAKILDELEIYPTSFSKYGTAYKQQQEKKLKKEKVNHCA